jgi:hypothetical protein
MGVVLRHGRGAEIVVASFKTVNGTAAMRR